MHWQTAVVQERSLPHCLGGHCRPALGSIAHERGGVVSRSGMISQVPATSSTTKSHLQHLYTSYLQSTVFNVLSHSYCPVLPCHRQVIYSVWLCHWRYRCWHWMRDGCIEGEAINQPCSPARPVVPCPCRYESEKTILQGDPVLL